MRAVSACLLLLFAGSSSATTITYDVTNITANIWEYSYTLSNDTLGVDIEEFTIYFDYNAYENLTSAAPTGWDPLVIQPDTELPDDGFYDALLVSGSGIGAGDSLGGFSVQFAYLLGGTPGSQDFDIVDPVTFDVLDSGQTVLTTVPLPAALWLFGAGLLGMLSLGKAPYRNSV